MADSTSLTILRIICQDGSPISLSKILLTKIGPGGIDKLDCKEFEKELGRIPDMRQVNKQIFDWDRRTLLGRLNTEKGDEPWKCDHMMYVCLDKRSGLPRNTKMVELVEIDTRGTFVENPIKIYGDVFVFRMQSNLEGSHMGPKKETRYIDMDENFVWNVNVRSGAWTILRRILLRPQKGDLDVMKALMEEGNYK